MPMSRSEIMSRIRGKDTVPELVVRKALHRLGFIGYETQYGEFRVDVAFVKEKVAVFVDGCFWHGCPEHFRLPKTNVGFWRNKVERNKRRAEKADAKLKCGGWSVVRIWEHQLKSDIDDLLLSALNDVKRKRRAIEI